MIRSEFLFFHFDDSENSDIENPPELKNDFDNKVGKVDNNEGQKGINKEFLANVLTEEENMH